MTLEVNNLKEILQDQSKHLTDLLSLAEEQLQALKADDIQKLTEITALQEEKGWQLALLEKKRREVLSAYSINVGKEINYFSDLFQFLDNQDQEYLQKLAEEIRNKHNNLSEANELNKLLLKQGLMYTNRVLSCISTPQNVYGKTGNVQNSTDCKIIDKSV